MDKDKVYSLLQILADRCDFAGAVDAIGFSRTTAGPGHELAALPRDKWTDHLWSYAQRLVAHHGAQLLKADLASADDINVIRSAVKSKDLATPKIPTWWIEIRKDKGETLVHLSAPSNTELAKNLSFNQGAFRPAGHGAYWVVDPKWAFVITSAWIEKFTSVGQGVREVLQESYKNATDDMKESIKERIIDIDENKENYIIYADEPFDQWALKKFNPEWKESPSRIRKLEAYLPVTSDTSLYVYGYRGHQTMGVMNEAMKIAAPLAIDAKREAYSNEMRMKF